MKTRIEILFAFREKTYIRVQNKYVNTKYNNIFETKNTYRVKKNDKKNV